MRKLCRSHAVVLLATLGSGCYPSTAPSARYVCAPLFPNAVAVMVRDSVTDRELTDSARGTWTDGTRSDSLRREFNAGGRANVELIGGSGVALFTVRVVRDGYRPWTRGGIQSRLHDGPCPQHITTVVIARLQR